MPGPHRWKDKTQQLGPKGEEDVQPRCIKHGEVRERHLGTRKTMVYNLVGDKHMAG